ncbi:MAG TPA: ATP-binding cassette domain-containing protein [Terriglobales bacterium]|nr:ATP-binding cassette domain-containing protein [Terriglobales bacterium]
MPTEGHANAVALRVCGLSKRYWVRDKGLWRRSALNAACDVSFDIPAGRTLGLVGSSGSGKSTVARCVTRLERPDAGEIWLGETDIARLKAAEIRPFRSAIQMIFQDPVTSMNPRMSAAEVIEEPLLIQGRGTREDRRANCAELMEKVQLSAGWLDRRITEFSGGQRQRIAIARALTLRPKVLVLDEALSGLDISTQAEVAELLQELQAAYSLTYLFISHDLPLVARMADWIAVMSAGKIVEQGPVREIISNPKHPETQKLVGAAAHFGAALAKAQGASA